MSKLKTMDSLDDCDKEDDATFFDNNFEVNKLFPGGLSYFYKGVKVPAFVTFSESGGMTGSILTDIFRRLDDLKLYNDDRKQ